MAQTRKLCFFIGINWRDGGTISDHFRALAQALTSRGHTVVLIVDQQRHDLEDHTANPAIYTWPSLSPTKPRDMVFMLKLIRRYRPVCLIGVFRSVNLMVLGGWLARVPYRIAWYFTTSSQSVFEPDGPSQFQRRFQIWRKSLLYKFATRIVTSTRAMQRDLDEVYHVPGRKVEIFPNTISAPADRLLELPKDPHKIICVGRLYVLKGQETLIRAIALLIADFPDLTANFFGTGPLLENYQRLAVELGVEHLCQFRGAIPHDKVLENMATSAITIVPSKDEAFGYVNIESMAVATPVIASRVGGIPEIIRDEVDGCLVSPDDPEALAACIKRLLSNSRLRAELGQNARERFLTHFEQRGSIEQQATYFENMAYNGLDH